MIGSSFTIAEIKVFIVRDALGLFDIQSFVTSLYHIRVHPILGYNLYLLFVFLHRIPPLELGSTWDGMAAYMGRICTTEATVPNFAMSLRANAAGRSLHTVHLIVDIYFLFLFVTVIIFYCVNPYRDRC
jgi:hypothetical protein